MKIPFVFLLLMSVAHAAIGVNDKAPNFELVDMDGKQVSLNDYKGKTVVLEWFNHGCPFVRKHYDSGNMQKLQQKYTKKGVVWLSIVSSAEGKQGHLTPKAAQKKKLEEKSGASNFLLDPEGKVGQLYAAKTTPHMYVINKTGDLVYQGAIDSISSADPSDISKAKNYVDLALSEILAGRKVTAQRTQPYGCSVKYK